MALGQACGEQALDLGVSAGELVDVIERAQQARRLDCPYVFHHGGQPLRDWRVSWRQACTMGSV
jgi:hypothetical protein